MWTKTENMATYFHETVKIGRTGHKDMCRELQDPQKDVANHAGVQACWSWNGKIVAKDLKGKIKSVRYGSNWQSLFPIHAPSDQEPMAEEVPESHWVHCLTH